ncbi:MAG: iron ABC transporter substrate-binding protein [Actinomycetota bacterium]|nr:iron ABC transporter substrate-binding protein [Actinomycetota bacterium]
MSISLTRPRIGRRWPAAAALGALGLSLVLTGCGGDDAEAASCVEGGGSFGPESDDTEQVEPVDDGELVVYSGRNEELLGPLYEQFTDESGIEVSVRYSDSATLAGQLLEEGSQTPADVYVSQDAGALGALAKGGCLAELPDEVLDLVPEGYRADDGNWVGLTGRARVIAYNPDLVAEDELPESIQDVNDEQWRGQVGIAPGNASFQAFVTAMRVLEGEDAARSFLEGLVDNDVQVFDGNGAILDAVDAGDLAMGLINHYYRFELAAEVGEENVTAQLHYLRDGGAGSLINISGVAQLAESDRSEDARALVDFLLSEQAQTYFAEVTYEYPLIDGVPAAADLPDLDSLDAPEFDLSDLDTLAETTELIAEVGLS